jgi:DNA-directed RNA polymerase subunit beta'
VDGPLIPQDILRINGEEALQQYLLRDIQGVYRSFGVPIDDKHVEIIISQMMRKVQVANPGDSDFLPGALEDKYLVRTANEALTDKKKQPATASPVLMGITKASLQSESWLSAASFQETTKVLTEAALAGKVDELRGLKENVLLGHLIPAGTGFKAYQLGDLKKNVDEALKMPAAEAEGPLPESPALTKSAG